MTTALDHRALRRTALLLAAMAYAVSAVCLLSPSAAGAQKSHHAAKGTQTGLASFYGRAFDGKETASGEPFDSDELTAAHPSYPLGTRVRVTNLEKGGSVVVRVTDRGPTSPNRRKGVIIDLSRAAASRLQMRKDGLARVRLQVLEWGKNEKKEQEPPKSTASAG
jgi:rare lipoprotein A